jgi:hypothetical protein
MSDSYTFTITVAKRDDLDHPRDEQEAYYLVKERLESGSLLDIVSINWRPNE